MKTILTIITSLLLTATAAAKGTETNSSEAMKKDVERFIKADDKKTGFSHPGTGHYVWNFKYLLNESVAASALPLAVLLMARHILVTHMFPL